MDGGMITPSSALVACSAAAKLVGYVAPDALAPHLRGVQ